MVMCILFFCSVQIFVFACWTVCFEDKYEMRKLCPSILGSPLLLHMNDILLSCIMSLPLFSRVPGCFASNVIRCCMCRCFCHAICFSRTLILITECSTLDYFCSMSDESKCTKSLNCCRIFSVHLYTKLDVRTNWIHMWLLVSSYLQYGFGSFLLSDMEYIFMHWIGCCGTYVFADFSISSHLPAR